MILKFDSTCSHHCIFTSDTVSYKQTLDEMAGYTLWVHSSYSMNIFQNMYIHMHIYFYDENCPLRERERERERERDLQCDLCSRILYQG